MARYVFLTFLALCVLACPSERKPTEPCDGSEAAFVVRIVAGTSVLPPNTVVTVQYGGGEEQYRLAEPATNNEVLFCDMLRDGGTPADAGSAPVDVVALDCELWTEGSAMLSVVGGLYPEIERDLEAKLDACGDVRTEEVLIDIVPSDGGA